MLIADFKRLCCKPGKIKKDKDGTFLKFNTDLMKFDLPILALKNTYLVQITRFYIPVRLR